MDDAKEFERIIADANAKLFTLSTQLMDLNHDAIQDLRQVINNLRKLREEFDDIFDELMMVHIGAAKTLADLYGEIILKEAGLVEVEEEDSDESGDGAQ